jgi:peptide/nickel transport system substrate-binding protein
MSKRSSGDRRFGRALALLLAGTLLLAACGGGGGETETEATGGGGASEGATAATEAAGGGADDGEEVSFIYAAAGVPETLDVWSTYQGDPSRVQMYEWGSTLVSYDASDLEDGGCTELATTENIQPGLAESWEVADDGTLTFTLRQGVMSPAGNEMTAEDAVWSLNRARELSTVVQFLTNDLAHFAETDAFVAVDDHTLQVNVERPTALDVSVFSYPMFSILDSATIQEQAGEGDPLGNEWLKTNTANYGPWALESFTPGQEAVYTAHADWWNAEERGNLDRLVIRNVAESSTRLQLVSTGEADYAERLSFQEYQQLEQAGQATVLSCVSPNRDTLILNTQFEPFATAEVRRAISLAIDREALVQGVYLGFAEPSTTGMSQVYLEDASGLSTFEHDPDQARSLLEAQGVTDLSFTITASPTRPGAHAESLAVQIQSMLSDVGVNAQVDVVAGSTEFSDAFFDGNYEAIMYLEPPALADPFYSANLYNTTASFQNTFGYDNPQYDDLAAQIEQTPPGDERQALIQQISDLIVEDVPMVYLVERSYNHAFAPGISGYLNTPHGSLLTWQMTKEG